MLKMRAVSLFSGCGGFDWGAHQCGIEIVWANDIDKYAASGYKSLFPDVPFACGDIRDISSFPSAEILIGCYPCTGFSLAARRRWKDSGERNLMETSGNFLYQEYLRALKQIMPMYFFVENVAGMVSAVDGWFFEQQLEGFRENGYVVQSTTLKASDFGAAQDRKRVFIVGVRKDIHDKKPYHFPLPTHGGEGQPQRKTMRDVLAGLDPWPEGEFTAVKFHGHYLTRNRKRAWDEQSFTIVANASHVPLHPSGEPMAYVEKDKWKLQGAINRRLSWQECRILQCLPDTLQVDGNLNAKYRVVGNAVPPVLSQALLSQIPKR